MPQLIFANYALFPSKTQKVILAIFQYKLGSGQNIGVQKPWQILGFAIKVIKILLEMNDWDPNGAKKT